MNAILGWKSRTRERLDVHKCPTCHVNSVEIGGNADGFWCPSCGTQSPFDDWAHVTEMTDVAICAVCDERTPLTVDSLVDGFYLCANPNIQCLNVVAVRTGRQIVHTNSVLAVDWVPSMLSRSHALPLLPYRVTEARADDEYVLVRLLCRCAKREESFHCRAEKGDGLVLVCTDAKAYIGYLDSSTDDDGTPLLHQIFIADDHRSVAWGLSC
jgi:hypothetical protein